MSGIILGLHILICTLLILVVLLQRSKGAGLSGVFGGGGAQTVFGGRGAAPFLAKATSILAILFMTTSLSLALISARKIAPKPAIQREIERGLGTYPPATEVVPLIPLTPPIQESPPSGELGVGQGDRARQSETQEEDKSPFENQ